MLASAIWILLMGFFAGELARRLKLPPLVGMILVGIGIGPHLGGRIAGAEPYDFFISQDVLDAAGSLRLIAVMVILMKAGLGLDREKLFLQGSVALRLSFLPAAIEALVVAGVAMWLFDFNLMTGLLLGCVVGAESPAVIVPGMLRLKSLGLGIKKGIPDVILTGCAASDILMLSVFSLLLASLAQGRAEAVGLFGVSLPPELMLFPNVGLQIILGIMIGILGARILEVLLRIQNWTHNTTQSMIIAGSIALALVVISAIFPLYSGYLAVATMGLFLVKFDAPLARVLRGGFDVMWVVAEIVLFVLLGATVQLDVLGENALRGLLLLAIGILVGRSIGLYLSTLGNTSWNKKEKLFLLPATMAKATVQAAIGALPLAAGISGGEIILAIAALSILTTAPIGAWLIQILAPKWLDEDEVDPTKVAVSGFPTFLAIVNTCGINVSRDNISPEGFRSQEAEASNLLDSKLMANDSSLENSSRFNLMPNTYSRTSAVLRKAADLARRTNGEVIVICWHASNKVSNVEEERLKSQIKLILADIRHDVHHFFKHSKSEHSKTISDMINKFSHDYIVIEQQDLLYRDVLIVSRSSIISIPQEYKL